MQVYQTNQFGFYVGPVAADPDPLDAGNWLIPGGCVTVAPPAIPEGKTAKWDNSAWAVVNPPAEPDSPEPAPEPTVEELRAAMRLSFPQLLFGLAVEQWITQAEGEAWLLQRTLPAALEALIVGLPPEQQLLVRARALQPTEILRTDPMVIALGQAQGKTAEQLDAFFTTYAQV